MKIYSNLLKALFFCSCLFAFSTMTEEVFLKTYGFSSDTDHYSRTFFDVSIYSVCLHRFVPEVKTAGTVVYSHGFLDSTGISRNVIDYLLSRGYVVYSLDLPGHGLSSGSRAEIDNFHTFGDLVNLVVKTIEYNDDETLIVMGHSMGSSAIMDFLFRYESPFDKVILVCPLWRSTFWQVSKLAYILTNPIFDKLPRRYGGSSSDDNYNSFVRNEDPLTITDVPLSWFARLEKWQSKLSETDSTDDSVYLMMAGNDTVVNNRYNSRLIAEKFTVLDSFVLPGSRHSIFNETKSLRLKAFDILDLWLAK